MTAGSVSRNRRFAHRRIFQVTPEVYDHGLDLLAVSAAERLGPASAVIGIANGGIVPARSLGNLLHLPIYRVSARHNPTDAIYTDASGDVTCDVAPMTKALAGEVLMGQVLLIDDIFGTGATVDALRPALAPLLGPDTRVRTVMLCRNAGATTDPDLWLWTVDDWVRFPWEQPPPAGLPIEDLAVPSQVLPS